MDFITTYNRKATEFLRRGVVFLVAFQKISWLCGECWGRREVEIREWNQEATAALRWRGTGRSVGVGNQEKQMHYKCILWVQLTGLHIGLNVDLKDKKMSRKITEFGNMSNQGNGGATFWDGLYWRKGRFGKEDQRFSLDTMSLRCLRGSKVEVSGKLSCCSMVFESIAQVRGEVGNTQRSH